MNFPDITFVDADTDTIKAAVINEYESLTGRTLANGDPVRLFLESIASIFAQQRSKINYTGKMNLLAYATDDFLDHLGLLVGTTRLSASAAQTTLQITLSAAQQSAVIVPAGTRVTAGDGIFFATAEQAIIPIGSTTATVTGNCTTTGTSGNGYVAGQLKTIVDPVNYVSAIVNTTESSGGTDAETNDNYRDRIYEAPESFSCAGPDGAYEYWAKTASSDIVDVSITSPSAGTVQITPLLSGGQLPSSELLQDILDICSDDSVRPLTDNVTAVAPTTVSYDINAQYYIASSNQSQATTIKAAVATAINNYITWQCSKLGRDIDPSKLYAYMVDAGACKVSITSPVATVLTKAQVATVSATQIITFEGITDDD